MTAPHTRAGSTPVEGTTGPAGNRVSPGQRRPFTHTHEPRIRIPDRARSRGRHCSEDRGKGRSAGESRLRGSGRSGGGPGAGRGGSELPVSPSGPKSLAGRGASGDLAGRSRRGRIVCHGDNQRPKAKRENKRSCKKETHGSRHESTSLPGKSAPDDVSDSVFSCLSGPSPTGLGESLRTGLTELRNSRSYHHTYRTSGRCRCAPV